MTVASRRRAVKVTGRRLPSALDRRFEAVVFDWDGTAVPDRDADAGALRRLVEELCALGLDLAVITGTHVGNVDGQLGARPAGPGRLHFLVNRGSEVFQADEEGLHLLYRREATAEENAALDRAAAATVGALALRGVEAEIVSERLNRRKIDLIPDWVDPPKSAIDELLRTVEGRLFDAGIGGLRAAVDLGVDSARDEGVSDPRVTSDAKHVEIGLTDKSDSARWILDHLWRRGIGPGQVLIAGDEFGPLGGLTGSDSFLLVEEGARATAVSVGVEPTGVPTGVLAVPGGPESFLGLLADQRTRRRRGAIPDVDRDPAWTVEVYGFEPRLERAHEALLTIADGRLGTRGAPLVGDGGTAPDVLFAGVYDGDGPAAELAKSPHWARLAAHGWVGTRRRTLDLHSGLLHEEGPLTSLRFSSLRRPGTVALRASGDSDALPRSRRRTVGRQVTAAFRDRRRQDVFERIGSYDPDREAAEKALAAAESAGFDRLLAEHRDEWGGRWAGADVVIDGDDELQRAVRVALFHLMASVPDRGEAGVGARGLSGSAYRGHVFWDSDVFVLPFLAATHPPAARAMLEYRVQRLPAARVAAARLGRKGARFPWESAIDGYDVTPSSARLPTGELVPIRTGELEEHIVADVAWAAAQYIDWTGDVDFAAGPGQQLIAETARYWASRVRFDQEGRAHIYGVIGPDEYHEPVDDNAFTNVIARWNLRRAAELDGNDEREREEWLAVADALVDGYDPVTGVYEQFAGFHRLEPIMIAEVAPRRPIAADVLLGWQRVRGAQVLKQADVLMLHHLLPDDVQSGSLLPNLEFYEPRTAHGSSLSPAVHAALFARARRFEEALVALSIAARIDLDDLTGSTAGGLHLATMGGVWQALAFGFAGVRPAGSRLVVDPRLPPQWHSLELALRFRGEPLRLRIDRRGVAIDSNTLKLRRKDGIWEVVSP